MRHGFVALLFGVLLLAGCRSAPSTSSAPMPTIDVTVLEPWSEAEEASYQRAEQQLDRLISVDYRDQSLEDVLDDLSERAGVGFVVHYSALELVGVNEATPVQRMSLQRVPLRQVMEQVLVHASAEQFDDDKASFVNDRGVVVISRRGELDALTQTRVYNIRPLVRGAMLPLRVSFHSGRSDLSRDLRLWSDRMYGHPLFRPVALSIFDWHLRQLKRDRDDLQRKLRYDTDGTGAIFQIETIDYSTVSEQINSLIQSLADQYGWDQSHEMIREFNNDLIIDTTRQTHEEIEALLNALLAHEVREREQLFADWEIARSLDEALLRYVDGDPAGARRIIDRALTHDPGHPTALAFQRFLDHRTK